MLLVIVIINVLLLDILIGVLLVRYKKANKQTNENFKKVKAWLEELSDYVYHTAYNKTGISQPSKKTTKVPQQGSEGHEWED